MQYFLDDILCLDRQLSYANNIGVVLSLRHFHLIFFSVLDWNAYERYNKSVEPSGGSSTSLRVLPESGFTVSLFRFLQLLCEGHNIGLCMCVCVCVWKWEGGGDGHYSVDAA